MSVAIHGPRREALRQLEGDIEQVQASTRRLLLALLELDDADLDAPATTGLGTRRHILARLARQSDRAGDVLVGRSAGVDDDTLLSAPLPAVVDAVTASLGATLDAIAAATSDGSLPVLTAVVTDHLAWLELTLADLGADGSLATIPALDDDAVAAHLSDDGHSPPASLVAA